MARARSRRRRKTRRNPRLRLKYYRTPAQRARKHRRKKSRNRRRRSHARRRHRPTRYRTYRGLSRRRGPRRAAAIWRKRTKYVSSNPRRRRRHRGLRGNPFSMPSMGSLTGVLKTGGQVFVGWVGVNAVLAAADRFGLAKIKASQSAPVAALINAAVRTIATPFIAKLASRFLKMDSSKVAAGGAICVVLHGVQDVVAAKPGIVPAQLQPMLLGYDGFGDFVTVNSRSGGRMAGFVNQANFASSGMRGLEGAGFLERSTF